MDRNSHRDNNNQSYGTIHYIHINLYLAWIRARDQRPELKSRLIRGPLNLRFLDFKQRQNTQHTVALISCLPSELPY
jgi:hypothetical protein